MVIQDYIESSQVNTLKRKARSLDPPQTNAQPAKRSRSEPTETFPSVEKWLLHLPCDEPFDEADDMSLPPPKRSRSSDTLSRRPSQSGDSTESTVSRDKKYSAYRDVNYPVVLETKGSFMRPSKAGLVDEDRILSEKLLVLSQPVPDNSLFDDARFEKFHSLLRGRSEARVYLDLHPLIVPSAENLYISGREEFDGLIEGHNDLWVKSIPFYGPRPQPDHTYGFKWSNFTETQRRKLNIEPTEQSLYTAREDIYFPFLTSEVKCGKQGLDLADRPNTHSMTIALRGIVDLYRKANRSSDVHRRALGFSISHDDNSARIYVHYPEIDGNDTVYWRNTIKELNFRDGRGREKWTCYQFTLNVCQLFAPALLKRLKTVIDELPDPVAQTLEPASFDDLSVLSSQDDASAPDSQDESFRKPRKASGLHVELRTMIQNLQRQLDQQRVDSMAQLEQQRHESEQQRVMLTAQLEQQRKDSTAQLEQRMQDSEQQRAMLMAQLEQQRKDSEQQQKELVQLLKQQSEQIRELSLKR